MHMFDACAETTVKNEDYFDVNEKLENWTEFINAHEHTG